MGRKEEGLLTGSYFFIGMFFVVALVIGEYASCTSRDKKAAGANRT